jgi:hypothetical protein
MACLQVRTTAELALVKEQLAAADSHVQQFRSISIATEGSTLELVISTHCEFTYIPILFVL